MLNRLAALAGIVALVIAALALLRDVFDFTWTPWVLPSTSSSTSSESSGSTSSPTAVSTPNSPALNPVPTVSPSFNPSPPVVNSPTTTFTQLNEGILFQLTGCRSESETIKCEFLVVDQTDDRELHIYGRYRDRSRIIDPEGTQYDAERVVFGGKENSAYVGQNLVQGIGLKALITFEKVPAQVSRLDLVEVSAHTQNQGYFTIRFRDIPVSN